MPSRLSWRAQKLHPASFDNLILAINQRLNELSVAARAADPTASAPLLSSNVVNNLVIGRGHYFELTVNGANARLTGLTGGDQGGLSSSKRGGIRQLTPPRPQLLREYRRQPIHQSRGNQCDYPYWWGAGGAV